MLPNVIALLNPSVNMILIFYHPQEFLPSVFVILYRSKFQSMVLGPSAALVQIWQSLQEPDLRIKTHRGELFPSALQ
jgi:hypothetical protein